MMVIQYSHSNFFLITSNFHGFKFIYKLPHAFDISWHILNDFHSTSMKSLQAGHILSTARRWKTFLLAFYIYFALSTCLTRPTFSINRKIPWLHCFKIFTFALRFFQMLHISRRATLDRMIWFLHMENQNHFLLPGFEVLVRRFLDLQGVCKMVQFAIKVWKKEGGNENHCEPKELQAQLSEFFEPKIGAFYSKSCSGSQSQPTIVTTMIILNLLGFPSYYSN